jgi:DNA-binding transcriptional MocR family regulator
MGYISYITVFSHSLISFLSCVVFISVPIDSEGVDVTAMENIVREEKSKGSWNVTEEKPFWAMFYTIPIFHNPTGITLPKGTGLIISNGMVVLNGSSSR